MPRPARPGITPLPGPAFLAGLTPARASRPNSSPMCGRYAAFRLLDDIRRIFGTVNPPPDFAPTWNMAPSRLAPVVRVHPQTNTRHLDLLRWGLVPHWARDPAAIRQPINARSETAATAPMFRDAYARRRCIVPADAFYEWQKTGGARLPHAIARADGAPLALAGLWEGWRGPGRAVLRSFTGADPDHRLRGAARPCTSACRWCWSRRTGRSGSGGGRAASRRCCARRRLLSGSGRLPGQQRAQRRRPSARPGAFAGLTVWPVRHPIEPACARANRAVVSSVPRTEENPI